MTHYGTLGAFPSQRYALDFNIPFLSKATPSAASRSNFLSHMKLDVLASGFMFVALVFSLPHSPMKPPINRLDAMTRWHGAAGANGFLRRAPPTTHVNRKRIIHRDFVMSSKRTHTSTGRASPQSLRDSLHKHKCASGPKEMCKWGANEQPCRS